MVLECNGVVHRVEVVGTGKISVGERLAGDQPTALVRTESEQLTGYEPDLGTVTVSDRGPAFGEFVAPKASQEFPAAESLAQNLTVTTQRNPCGGGLPATFAARGPFQVQNSALTAFPPQNAVYLLPNPVELIDTANPSGPSITLTEFPLTVSQSS